MKKKYSHKQSHMENKVIKLCDLPVNYNAVTILEHNLKDRADKDALFSVERGKMTFQQVSNEVNQLGNALKRLDVRRGDYVAILSLDCAEWAIAFFATIKIGAISIGMNTMSKPADLAYYFKDCRPRVLIIHNLLLTTLDQIRSELNFVKHIITIGGSGHTTDIDYENLVNAESTKLDVVNTHREEFCSLNYTSGSTGEPKGIQHSHKDLPITSQLWAANILRLSESDRTFATSKLFFTFGTGGNLVFPWYVGASCIFLSEHPRDPSKVLETIQRFQPTVFYNTPTGFASILASKDFVSGKYNLSSIRICVSAGEALPATLWFRWKEQTSIDIIDGIGCTEIWHIFISNRPDDIRPGSSGKVVPGYEVKIVDEQGLIVRRGEIGNLMVKSETTALFYLHKSEQSRKTFIGEWLVTGDKYYEDENGYYWHCGRSDDMLKVGGLWVSPIEVENAILSHLDVLECVVVGHPDNATLIKPKAFIVLKEGVVASELLKEEIIIHCKEQIADYKRPRWIEFVSELPKTETGKIKRFKMRK